MEKVFLGKGRTEYVGFVSGDIYIVDDDGTFYYYLINILNPDDIYVISKTNNIKKGKEVKPPKELLTFHKHCKSLQTKHVQTLKESIRDEKLEDNHSLLSNLFIHDIETTKYVISQIGTNYKNVHLEYCGNRLYVYTIDNIWELRIEGYKKQQRKFSLNNKAKSKEEYSRKLNLLMTTTGMPKKICQSFIKRFTDDEALKALFQILHDHNAVQQDSSYLSDIKTDFNYMEYLNKQTGIKKFHFIPFEKQSNIFKYVFF